MYKQYIRLAMAVVLAASLTMAACGGGDGSGGAVSNDTASTKSSSASSTKPSSASASSSQSSSSVQVANSSSADVTPDAMDFGTTTALAGEKVHSLIATITGIDIPVYFTVTGIDNEHYNPQYRIDGGAWQPVTIGLPKTVTEGQTIQFSVRVPPVAAFDTIRFHVKVGNLQTQWVVIPK